MKRFLLRAFTLGYPFINAVYEGSIFIYQLLYLYDYTSYFSPFHHLQGLTLKRLSVQEMVTKKCNNNINYNYFISELKVLKMRTEGKKDFAIFVEVLYL